VRRWRWASEHFAVPGPLSCQRTPELCLRKSRGSGGRAPSQAAQQSSLRRVSVSWWLPSVSDYPDDLLSVPTSQQAGHSLLLSPEGKPWKPGQGPTHLTLGFPKEHQELKPMAPSRLDVRSNRL